MTALIPQRILDEIEFIVQFIDKSTNSWLVVKKELLRQLSSEYKNYFSIRHDITKLHSLNDMEIEIIKIWKEYTGIELILFDENKHPENWESPKEKYNQYLRENIASFVINLKEQRKKLGIKRKSRIREPRSVDISNFVEEKQNEDELKRSDYAEKIYLNPKTYIKKPKKRIKRKRVFFWERENRIKRRPPRNPKASGKPNK